MEPIKTQERTIADMMTELNNAQHHVACLKQELADAKQLHEAYDAGYEAGRMLRALLYGLKDAGMSENQAFKLVMLFAERLDLE